MTKKALTNNLLQSCPDRVTPPLPFSSGEEYVRLLKEAIKESNPSSLISSRRDTPKAGSPKSPINSPNPEPSTNEELRGVFINYYGAKHEKDEKYDKDWMWQWSSRSDQLPPKDWKLEHPDHKDKSKPTKALKDSDDDSDNASGGKRSDSDSEGSDKDSKHSDDD